MPDGAVEHAHHRPRQGQHRPPPVTATLLHEVVVALRLDVTEQDEPLLLGIGELV